MRNYKSQLTLSADAPALPGKRLNALGNSGDTSQLVYKSAGMRQWLHHFGHRRQSVSNPTWTDIRNIEARVKKELYP